MSGQIVGLQAIGERLGYTGARVQQLIRDGKLLAWRQGVFGRPQGLRVWVTTDELITRSFIARCLRDRELLVKETEERRIRRTQGKQAAPRTRGRRKSDPIPTPGDDTNPKS